MKELKILYLEDSPQDAEFAGRILKTAGIDFTFKLVDTQDEYREALKEYRPDIILADHSLFQFNSSEALKIFRATGLKIPFILVTGTVSEEFAVNILKEGADDYLLKDNLIRLPNAILNSLEKYHIEKERQQYLDKIIANEALMKEAEGVAQFGSWEADAITGEVKWSDGVFRILGYEPGEVRPGHDMILRHVHPDDRSVYQNAMFSVLPEHDTYGSEFRFIDKKGLSKFVFFEAVVKRNNNGQLSRFLGFMQDITEKRKLEKELAEQQLYQQKLITEVTIQAQEKERNELGRELHDNINQLLATVKMYIGIAKSKENLKDDLLESCYVYVNEAMEEIRKLSHSLVAPSLGDMGLQEALQELAQEINFTTGLQIQLINEINTGQIIDDKKELMLYRIVQEQMNNISKYANAKLIVIQLKSENDNLYLSIADNGIGFDTKKKAKGIGLKNIKSRVEFYSGKMNITSSPGQGCKLELTIPL